ncbi:MAG TPA: TetR/AcrR family transcriptional regulator [Clostridia bacterium]|nr:TetR/AcrR family transcriptional regulator [Clostridia bacterium]
MELRKTLLACASRIECTEGVDAINIRRLAKEANIAVGTVYNYFESKQEVLLALTEEYWQNALEEMRHRITAARFSDQIAQIIVFLRTKMNDCAKVLMKSLRDDAATGQIRMSAMQSVLKQALVERLDRDSTIRTGVWSENFTKESFAGFLLINLVILMQQENGDEGTLLEILDRILY